MFGSEIPQASPRGRESPRVDPCPCPTPQARSEAEMLRSAKDDLMIHEYLCFSQQQKDFNGKGIFKNCSGYLNV